MTFTLDIKTSEEKAVEALEQAREVSKREARRRILAVADETAQINLAAAVAAQVITAEELAAYRAGLAWVAGMRAAWGPMADAGLDPSDDANWPAVPAGVAELAGRF